MKGREYFKRAMAGVSAFAIGATTIIPAVPVWAVNADELTREEVAANDYVLYTVNCGTPDSSVMPNENSERMGLLQSSVDQAYGEDPVTGNTWGCDLATEFSEAKKSGDDATDIGNSFVYMSDGVQFDKYKSSLGYSFEVPQNPMEGIEKDTYEVTVAFKHYWDSRSVNICLEDNTVATDIELGYGEWVSKTFTTTVTDGVLNVDIKSPRRTGTSMDPVLNYIKIRAVEDTEKQIQTYDSFTGTMGETMYDTNGNQIQAHGGQIQRLTVDGKQKWYWIGEDKTNDYRPVGGIHIYSSEDLYNWDDEGVVLRTMEDPEQFETDPYFSELYGTLTEEEQAEIFIDLDKNNTVMERPKMLYNDKTGKYVIWFHADGRIPGSDADYGKAKAGIAVSDSPTGPFKFLGSYKLHHAGDNYGYDGEEGIGSVRDMNLFKDDDGTAYVIYSSEGNETTYISRLNEDYTGLAKPQGEAVEGEDFTRNFEKWSREAPAMFKYKDKYYIVNSGCTGWSPNPAQYAVADAPMGPWTSMGDPCPDWGKETTYDTQSTCVFPVDAQKGQYIYMGDRWNAGDLSESRYVWIPVEFQPDNQITLRRNDNWTLEDLKDKGLPEITSELPVTASSVTEVIDLLPAQVEISYGSEKETTPVTWNLSEEYDQNRIGTVTVIGNLTEKGETVTHKIHVVNPATKYFFDSAAAVSDYFEAAQAELGTKLLNSVPDQKYTEENKAGYTGTTEEESEVGFDIGKHEGESMMQNGWWAGEGKNIEYAFALTPGSYTLATGYQEWWNYTRTMKVTVAMDEKTLSEQEFTLDASDTDIQQTQAFEVTKAGNVIVTVSKTGNSDPVLSWIGIMGEQKEEPAPSEKVDVTSLNLAITMAEKLEEEQKENQCYTTESWNKAAEALKAARDLVKAAEITQEQVDEVFVNLITACNLLENEAQKVGLKAAIDGTAAILADTEKLSQYTPESVEAVRAALAEAQPIFDNAAADQETINQATTRLLTAVTSMLAVSEDTRLDILIQKAEQLLEKEAQYTPSSIANLKKALEAAKVINNNPQATEDQMKEAYNNLAAAMTALVRQANREELKNALDKAKEILKDASKYLNESLEGLQEAVDAAQAVYDNQEADQNQIGEVLKQLIQEVLEVRLMGDVDLNGTVDSEDAAKLLKYNVELEELTEEQMQIADVNKDGISDSSDAGSILQYAAEKITEF
ncbi:MAG: family 43 glycosylhydrolase [Lachnospiraceae bacterium]|nr:family 43 glycosylhydrolase [Lachnospiraceae bacterium]